MTVANNTSRNEYTATSGQTVFAYTFEIYDKDHITVVQNGVELSEGTDYTVSGVGNNSGGNVTFTVGATLNDNILLYREMPYSRTQNYTTSGDFLASEVNDDFDKLWLATEQVNRSFNQAIRKPIADSDSISMELPEAADRANKYLKFSATGEPTAVVTSTPGYEEGTFTPVVADAASGGNTASAGTFAGRYTKIGRFVNVTIALQNIGTAGMTAGNQVYIRGLPYTAYSSTSPILMYWVGQALGFYIYQSSDGPWMPVIVDNTDYIQIMATKQNQPFSDTMKVSEINSGPGDIYLSISYEAA